MRTFYLIAEKNKLTIRKKEPVTSGSVNVYTVQIEFSEDWDNLDKTAVFRAGCVKRSAVIADGICTIPGEVLGSAGHYLMAGVCGKQGDAVVLPTVWANLGLILEGAVPRGGQEPIPPPEGWQEVLEGKGDNLDLDGQTLKLRSGEKVLSSVDLPGSGGGESGAADHRVLSYRDAAEQHPIDAITGLRQELDRIPAPVEAITNEELEEMLK